MLRCFLQFGEDVPPSCIDALFEEVDKVSGLRYHLPDEHTLQLSPLDASDSYTIGASG